MSSGGSRVRGIGSRVHGASFGFGIDDRSLKTLFCSFRSSFHPKALCTRHSFVQSFIQTARDCFGY